MELRGCPSTWPHHYGEHWSHLTRPAGAALNVWQVFGENPPQCSINIKWNEREGPVVISEHQFQECRVVNSGPFFFMLKEGNWCLHGGNCMFRTHTFSCPKFLPIFPAKYNTILIILTKMSANKDVGTYRNSFDLSLNLLWQYIIQSMFPLLYLTDYCL